MRLYIATPVTARKGKTLREKIATAKLRIKVLKEILADEPEFKDYELVSTFDIPHRDRNEYFILGECVTFVLCCDAILLDHGWQTSKGCNLEYRAAKIYGKKIYEFDKLD